MTKLIVLVLLLACAGCESLITTCTIICGADPILVQPGTVSLCVCPGGRIYRHNLDWEIAAEACK